MSGVSPQDPALRLTRAAVFATVCVVVSAGGHAFAGGASISWTALLLGTAVSLALALALGGRERAKETVLAATAGTQILLHQLFTETSPAHVPPDAHGHLNVGMTLVHLVIALLTGWWLHRGEHALWTMARLWAAAPFRLLPLVLTIPAPSLVRPAVPGSETEPRRSREFAAAVHRRGPPEPARVG